MKKRERKTGRRFKATAYDQAVGRQPEELEPEELAIYVHRAEEKVLPHHQGIESRSGSSAVSPCSTNPRPGYRGTAIGHGG